MSRTHKDAPYEVLARSKKYGILVTWSGYGTAERKTEYVRNNYGRRMFGKSDVEFIRYLRKASRHVAKQTLRNCVDYDEMLLPVTKKSDRMSLPSW